MEEQEVVFVSLAELLSDRGVSIGSLATEIERAGVYGWDRFGRFVRFGKEKQESLRALDGLALHYAKSIDPRDDGPGIPDPERDRLYLFGWRADQLPKFKEPTETVSKPDRPQAASRAEKTNLRIIEGLKRILLGKLTEHPHPDCATEEDLIAILEDHSTGREGLGRATLKRRFQDAAEAWDVA